MKYAAIILAVIFGGILASCSSPAGSSLPAVSVSPAPVTITIPVPNASPLLLRCTPSPFTCFGSYVVDGQTITVTYPAPK